MIIFKVLVLLGFLSLSQSKNIFMPNLPMGEYRVVFEKVYPCESTKNHSIQLNIFINKITSSTKEYRGNITFLVPFDDTLTIDLNLASWGSTGGWIPNSNSLITKKACSIMKNLGGNAWFTFIKGFNFPTHSCPLPTGTYITSGIDLKKFEDNNFPKVYFYGKYKLVYKANNVKNNLIGCEVVEFNLIRPWETPV